MRSDVVWCLAASSILGLLAALMTTAHGVVAVAFSLVPQAVVLLAANVLSVDIDRWSTGFRVLVFVAGFAYYLAISVVPSVVLRSTKAKVLASLAVLARPPKTVVLEMLVLPGTKNPGGRNETEAIQRRADHRNLKTA